MEFTDFQKKKNVEINEKDAEMESVRLDYKQRIEVLENEIEKNQLTFSQDKSKLQEEVKALELELEVTKDLLQTSKADELKIKKLSEELEEEKRNRIIETQERSTSYESKLENQQIKFQTERNAQEAKYKEFEIMHQQQVAQLHEQLKLQEEKLGESFNSFNKLKEDHSTLQDKNSQMDQILSNKFKNLENERSNQQEQIEKMKAKEHELENLMQEKIGLENKVKELKDQIAKKSKEADAVVQINEENAELKKLRKKHENAIKRSEETKLAIIKVREKMEELTSQYQTDWNNAIQDLDSFTEIIQSRGLETTIENLAGDDLNARNLGNESLSRHDQSLTQLKRTLLEEFPKYRRIVSNERGENDIPYFSSTVKKILLSIWIFVEVVILAILFLIWVEPEPHYPRPT